MIAAPDRQPFVLESIRLVPQRLRLAAPLVTAAGTFRQREINLVYAVVRVGQSRRNGVGEASPLAGWTAETAAGIRNAVAAMKYPVRLSCIGELDRAVPGLDASPVLRFGIELAILDAFGRMAGQALGVTLAGMRGATAAACVPNQFTLGADTADRCIRVLRAARAAGHTHAKLKVGTHAPELDLDRVRRIASACPNLALRLDANGAWSVDQALQLLTALPADRVEMVEQPVPDDRLEQLLARYDGRGPLIAADESCAEPRRIRALIGSGRLGAIVVKPSVVGGLLPASALFERALHHGVKVIVSNLMESAVGRRAIAHLAAAWPELEGPHGLATGHWLDQDVAEHADHLEGAHLYPGTRPGIGVDPILPVPE